MTTKAARNKSDYIKLKLMTNEKISHFTKADLITHVYNKTFVMYQASAECSFQLIQGNEFIEKLYWPSAVLEKLIFLDNHQAYINFSLEDKNGIKSYI